ncbi:MAG TPA: hypothetical protein VM938_05245 [Acidimicrobiales bacterium]|nr:hypothetical protein [Acidimicrobiales bacterium]
MLVACEDGADCATTSMEATAAEKVSLSAAAMLHARLTASGVGVPGQDVEFVVLDDGAEVYRGEATTDAEGHARHDLKTTLDPNAATSIARGDQWQADFDGDIAFCSSSDEAPFTLLGR